MVPCAVAKVMIDPYQEAVEEDWNHRIFESSIGHSEGASHGLTGIDHHEGRLSLFCNAFVSQSTLSSIRRSTSECNAEFEGSGHEYRVNLLYCEGAVDITSIC